MSLSAQHTSDICVLKYRHKVNFKLDNVDGYCLCFGRKAPKRCQNITDCEPASMLQKVMSGCQ